MRGDCKLFETLSGRVDQTQPTCVGIAKSPNPTLTMLEHTTHMRGDCKMFRICLSLLQRNTTHMRGDCKNVRASLCVKATTQPTHVGIAIQKDSAFSFGQHNPHAWGSQMGRLSQGASHRNTTHMRGDCKTITRPSTSRLQHNPHAWGLQCNPITSGAYGMTQPTCVGIAKPVR